MPRVVRRRLTSQTLDEQPEAIDAVTSDDGDHLSIQDTEEEYDSGDNSSESAVEMEVDEDDLEDVSLHERLPNARRDSRGGDDADDLENVSLRERLLGARTRRNSRNCNGLDGSASVSSTKKSSYKFTDKPAGRPCPPQKIIIRGPDGPAGPAARLDKLEQFWQALLPDEIFEKIVAHTNRQIEHECATMMAKDQAMQSYHHLTDVDEIKALVGLFYYAGARRDASVDTHDMWDKTHGITVYRCAMPRARFTFLCSCLRFDDKQTRDRADKFAPVREMWTTFIGNCRRCYNFGKKMTVDELMLGFKGRCPFRVCVKSKLGNEYGVKFVALNDVETGYLANAIPYLGRDSAKDKIAGETDSEYFFRKVTEPIHGSGRTVTCDSWFTSIALIDRFVEQPYKLTITGTIRKNKADIPARMKLASKRVPHTSFSGTENVTLLSHTPKRNKIVLVATSYSKSTGIADGKPDILRHYDETKGGTDLFDRLCRAHTVAMRTNRWPMRFFLGMLDQAAVNARVLFRSSRRNANKDDRIKAYNFLKDLALCLLRAHMRSRIDCPSLRADLRVGIRAISNVYEMPVKDDERPRLETKTKCEVLRPGKCSGKTRQLCPSCQRAMCDDHRVYLCVECASAD